MGLNKENYVYNYLKESNEVPLITATDVQALQNKLIDGNSNTIRTKAGTTAARPTSSVVGDLYYNQTLDALEVYTSNGWQPLVTAAPTLGSFTPTTAITLGTTITINGSNYVNGATVQFIGTDNVPRNAGSRTWVSALQMTATTPSLPVLYEPYLVRVTNPNGLFVTSATGIDAGSAPVVVTSPGLLGTIYDVSRDSVSFTIVASDADSQPLSYSIVAGALPSGLTLNSNTGVISGSTAAVVSDVTTNFTVQATDGTNATSVALSILQKPPVTVTYNVSAGSLQTFNVPTGLRQLSFKCWGSGGAGGFSSTGGAGGYVAGKVNLSSGTTALTMWVPDGGKYVASGGTVAYTPGYWPIGTTAKYGPGFSQSGGGGGGAAIIDTANSIIYAIAGAGGGGSGNFGNAADQKGGAGGGDVGQNGGGDKYGYGGTQSAGGRTAFNRQPAVNLVTNPSMENGSASGFNNYLPTSLTAVTGGLFGTYALRTAWSSNDGGGTYTLPPTGGGVTDSGWYPVSGNTTYTASVYVKSGNNNYSMFLGIEYNGVGAGGTTIGGTTTAALSTTSWTRLSNTFTTNASTTGVRLIVYKASLSGLTNDVMLTDGWMITQGSTLYDYFDGNFVNLFSGTTDFENTTSGWGTSGATLSAVTSTRVTGSYSMRVQISGTVNYVSTFQTISVNPGQTYTASAFLRAPTAWANSARFGINIVWQNNGSYVTETNTSGPVPGATSDWNRFSTSGVCPANANQASIRIFTATDNAPVMLGNNVDFYIDGASFYQNTFDSYSTTNPFAWTGTSNASMTNALGGSASPGAYGYGGAGSNSYTNFTNGGGEGGIGYYGGGGGDSGGGGGGSSWINPTYLVGGTKVSTTGSYATPANTGDAAYSAGIAVGGAAQTTGGNGRIVITY